LKVLFKQKYLEEDYGYILSRLGSVDVEILKKAVSEDEFGYLPSFLKDACKETVVDFELNKDPQRIDLIFDRALFAVILELAEEKYLKRR